MNLLGPSAFAGHPVYLLFRQEGAGRIDIEKVFDAFAGTPPCRDNIEAKIALLRELGFGDPVKMIVTLPAILGYARDNIEAKIALLRELGFGDPVKMIVSSPSILGYARDNIEAKIALLRELGFGDPVKMIVTLPAILGLARDNIEAKIALLRELGFGDPVKMIVTLPAILGYARDNIEAKIALLRELGFGDHAFLATYPAMFSYSPKRIRFLATVTDFIAKGNRALFCTLLSKKPAAVAVAASDPEAVDATCFGRQVRVRLQQGDGENLALLDMRHDHPMALAYFAYCGTPLEHPIFQQAAA